MPEHRRFRVRYPEEPVTAERRFRVCYREDPADAEAYRLQQAEALLRSAGYVPTDDGTWVPAFDPPESPEVDS